MYPLTLALLIGINFRDRALYSTSRNEVNFPPQCLMQKDTLGSNNLYYLITANVLRMS